MTLMSEYDGSRIISNGKKCEECEKYTETSQLTKKHFAPWCMSILSTFRNPESVLYCFTVIVPLPWEIMFCELLILLQDLALALFYYPCFYLLYCSMCTFTDIFTQFIAIYIFFEM